RLDRALQSGLRCGVGDLACQAGVPGQARDRDDAAVPPPPHAGQARLHNAERAGEVDVDVALPLLGRHAVRRSDGVDDCRVADAHVHVVEDLSGKRIVNDIDSDVDVAADVEGDHSQTVDA